MPKSIISACNHRLVGLMPNDNNFFSSDSRVEKLPDASKKTGLFAIYTYGTTNTKFKIYQHKFKELTSNREVVLNA